MYNHKANLYGLYYKCITFIICGRFFQQAFVKDLYIMSDTVPGDRYKMVNKINKFPTQNMSLAKTMQT